MATSADSTKTSETRTPNQRSRKHFVLDTNVLLHDPNALFRFEEHEVVIPLTVIEEIDRFKKNNDETGRNARQAIRSLDELRQKGRLFEGVSWNDLGGSVRIDRCDRSMNIALDLDIADNRILGVDHVARQALLGSEFHDGGIFADER